MSPELAKSNPWVTRCATDENGIRADRGLAIAGIAGQVGAFFLPSQMTHLLADGWAS